ncbi:MAG TPA: DUF1775 domain-containing protein [Solirubrobacteraceae bacterium]|nr:DUF1775 domain-containing protein [Solirubrobacteraceae bacterium]
MTAAVALGALAAPGAAAHVTVQPSASRPADLQRYRVIVPDERESSSTTGVDLKLPSGITFALVEAAAGWHASLLHRSSEVSEIRWSGGHVPPGGYAELHFIARNPVRAGPIAWKALQRYDDGQVVRWIGGEDSDEPAPTTLLSERAVPVDVVSTDGEALPAAAPPAAAAAGPSSQAATPGRNGLTLVIAIVGVVLGAAALGVSVRRRRPAIA